MKAIIATYFLMLLSIMLFSQKVTHLFPVNIVPLDFSKEAIDAWHTVEKNIEEIANNKKKLDDLSPAEINALQRYSEGFESIWDVIGKQCNWYCNALPVKTAATSHLKAKNRYTYHPQNIHDLNYRTAWIEGDKGNGEGELIYYTFNVHSPRISEIIAVNGYAKDKEIWQNNGRVKTMLMYVNDKPKYYLNLKDTIAEQVFRFPPIGFTPEIHKNLPDTITWSITFQIIDSYYGTSTSNTAITEIYFNNTEEQEATVSAPKK